MDTQNNFRILSLDGGGSWALIQVMTLITLYGESTKGHAVLKDFDLVAANSGGSIVLAGLIENLSLSDIRSFFKTSAIRTSMFAPTDMLGLRILGMLLTAPKYSTAKKKTALEALMPYGKGHSLLQAQGHVATANDGHVTRFVIVAFDYDNNHATFFRSFQPAQQKAPSPTAGVTVSDAVHASSTAPVKFFDEPAVLSSAPGRYLDGGLTGCNNPVQVAVNEALQLVSPGQEISVLSVGTGRSEYAEGTPHTRFHREKPGIDFARLIEAAALAVTGDPPDMATYNAHMALSLYHGVPADQPARLVRMNPLIKPFRDRHASGWMCADVMQPGQTAFQPTPEFDTLRHLGMDAVEDSEVDLIERYTNVWLTTELPLNQPIRIDRASLKASIGHDTFNDAKKAWLALCPAKPATKMPAPPLTPST